MNGITDGDDSVIEDVKKLKDNVDLLSKNNNSLRSDVISISNNISNINTALSKRLNITESDIATIKNNISELEDALNGIDITTVDITPIISDINDIKQNINDVSKELLNKIEKNVSEISKLKAKDIEFVNDISELNKEVLALHLEDKHIFEILNELQSINKSIISDIKLLKKDNENINNEILTLKEKIRYLTGVNVDNFETLEGAQRRLTKLEESDKEFQNTIDVINTNIESIETDTKNINNEISLLKDRIEYLTGIDSDSFNELDDINQEIKELKTTDMEVQKTIDELKKTINEGINAKLQWLIL